MLGMIGIIVQNNEIKNTTQILQVVKPGDKFLVRFLNPPAFSRVCLTEEIQQWLLFQNQDEANAWVAGSKQQQMELPAETSKPRGSNGSGKKAEATNEPSESGPEKPEDETDDPVIEPAEPVEQIATSVLPNKTDKGEDQ